MHVLRFVQFLCTAAIFPMHAAKVKRSIDQNHPDAYVKSVEDLKVLVQQQAMTIGSLQSDLVTVKTELTSLQTRLAQQESSCERRVTTLSSEVSDLSSRVNSGTSRHPKQVAFSAHYSHYGVQVNGDAVLKFNAVPTNIGGGYNSGTGKFTAPVSGVYLFLLHIINGDGDQKIEVDLVKSGTPIGKAIAEGSEQRYDKASAAATVHLYAGDTVYAAHSHLFLGAVLDGGWLCSFTGVLVTPDVA